MKNDATYNLTISEHERRVLIGSMAYEAIMPKIDPNLRETLMALLGRLKSLQPVGDSTE